jgi:hypothetical protein
MPCVFLGKGYEIWILRYGKALQEKISPENALIASQAPNAHGCAIKSVLKDDYFLRQGEIKQFS